MQPFITATVRRVGARDLLPLTCTALTQKEEFATATMGERVGAQNC